MRMVPVLMCVWVVMLAVPQAGAQPGGACVACGKTLGLQVPESALSADPDFKQHGMFQCCQTCLDRKMNRQTQLTYTKTAQKYKWNSISHNKALVFKSGRPGKI